MSRRYYRHYRRYGNYGYNRKYRNNRSYNHYTRSSDITGIIIIFLIIGSLYFISILDKIWDFIYINFEYILYYTSLCILIIAAILFVIFHKKIIDYFKSLKKVFIMEKLEKNGLLFKKIKELNENNYIGELEPFLYSYNVYKRSDLENCNIDDYLLMTIDQQNLNLTRYKSKYNSLLINFYEYENKYNELKQFVSDDEALSLHIKKSDYYEIQQIIFEQNKINKTYLFKVIIRINYIDKRGNNKGSKEKEYYLDEYCDLENEYSNIKGKRAFYEINSRIQRARMSESLRYDILKRDGFRCQICGATQADGVQLHVDHIIPVSKGGKSIPSNLQTLCSRCNIGKGNKTD